MRDNRFEGKLCNVCESTTRYKATGNCVKCRNRHNRNDPNNTRSQAEWIDFDNDKTARRRAAEDLLIKDDWG